MSKLVFFDIETKRPVLKKGEVPLPGIEYASSFQDSEGMGIACLCALEVENGDIRPRVFLSDNLIQFEALLYETDILIGFNSTKFDLPLYRHFIPEGNVVAPLPEFRHIDLLTVAYESAGLKNQAPYTAAHRGYNLDNLCKLNGLGEKSNSGALAPILWQQGKRGEVIDYCLRDVQLSHKLFKLLKQGSFINPKGELINVRMR